MIKQLRSNLKIFKLYEEAVGLTYQLDGSGALMASGPSTMSDNILSKVGLKSAIEEISQLLKLSPIYSMINKLPANTVVPRHRDWLKGTPLQPNKPCLERWHLPLSANPLCEYWDEINGKKIFTLGSWHGPIPYWVEHFVANSGKTDRIHLVVDLDCPTPLGSYND